MLPELHFPLLSAKIRRHLTAPGGLLQENSFWGPWSVHHVRDGVKEKVEGTYLLLGWGWGPVSLWSSHICHSR